MCFLRLAQKRYSNGARYCLCQHARTECVLQACASRWPMVKMHINKMFLTKDNLCKSYLSFPPCFLSVSTLSAVLKKVNLVNYLTLRKATVPIRKCTNYCLSWSSLTQTEVRHNSYAHDPQQGPVEDTICPLFLSSCLTLCLSLCCAKIQLCFLFTKKHTPSELGSTTHIFLRCMLVKELLTHLLAICQIKTHAEHTKYVHGLYL